MKNTVLDINKSEIDKAIVVLEDFIFKLEVNHSNPEDLKILKLLQCRENNFKFEYDIAEMICGEEENSFPYRSSYYLTEFFQRLGFNYQHNGETRRFWVENVLKQLNIQNISRIIRKGLFNKRDFRVYSKKLGIDYEILFSKAITEFQQFINDSLYENQDLDLAFLLNMNVNTDLLFNKSSSTDDAELNDLINEAKRRFLNPRDKQIALEKIWDAFERIKTYFDKDKKKSSEILISKISLNIDEIEFQNEFKALTEIGNKYRIRHHEKGKQEISDENQIDYLFFRILALIDLCLSKISNQQY